MKPNERLKLARVNAGYKSALAAAQALGLPQTTYTSHENGRTPFGKNAPIYAAEFGVPLDWLTEGAGYEIGVIQPDDFSRLIGVSRGQPISVEQGSIALGQRIFAMANNHSFFAGQWLLFDPDAPIVTDDIVLGAIGHEALLGHYRPLRPDGFMLTPLVSDIEPYALSGAKPLAKLVAILF